MGSQIYHDRYELPILSPRWSCSTWCGHSYIGMNHQMHWQSHFQLSDALFPQEIESGRKIFRFMITTDGVGASVFLTRWKWVLTYDETPEQRETRLETARAKYSEHLHAH